MPQSLLFVVAAAAFTHLARNQRFSLISLSSGICLSGGRPVAFRVVTEIILTGRIHLLVKRVFVLVFAALVYVRVKALLCHILACVLTLRGLDCMQLRVGLPDHRGGWRMRKCWLVWDSPSKANPV